MIGQSTFAGRIIRGTETHVGVGAFDGNLVSAQNSRLPHNGLAFAFPSDSTPAIRVVKPLGEASQANSTIIAARWPHGTPP
ncbi:MAG TPA: hypothetical protein VHR97_06560 [Candidatus Baltobacteraceae bacterium]|nr:hypothetical protein [Candidatus Baltobacteraceae bacterium]